MSRRGDALDRARAGDWSDWGRCAEGCRAEPGEACTYALGGPQAVGRRGRAEKLSPHANRPLIDECDPR